MLDVALDGRWVMTLTMVILCKMISAKFRSRKTTLNLPRARFNIEHWKSANQQSVSADWVQKLFCFVGEAFFAQFFWLFTFILPTAKIGFFYSVFYGVLAALVAVCMLVFLRTLDPRIPKWQLHESLIGTNPGMNWNLIYSVSIVYTTCYRWVVSSKRHRHWHDNRLSADTPKWKLIVIFGFNINRSGLPSTAPRG